MIIFGLNFVAMQKFRKCIFICLFQLALFLSPVISQDFYLGGYAGASLNKALASNYNAFQLSGMAEYRPLKSLISINADPSVYLQKNNFLISLPVYFKVILSAQSFNPDINYVGLRVSPYSGAFVRSNSNYGWLAGISVEYPFKRRLFVFGRWDYYKDYWTVITPRRNEITESDGSFWLQFGIKRNILY